MEERNFDVLTSRMFNTWTFLRQKAEGDYALEKTVKLDHRVWSQHELVNLFDRAGFEHEVVYPGFAPGFNPQQKAPMNLREMMQYFLLLYIFRRK